MSPAGVQDATVQRVLLGCVMAALQALNGMAAAPCGDRALARLVSLGNAAFLLPDSAGRAACAVLTQNEGLIGVAQAAVEAAAALQLKQAS